MKASATSHFPAILWPVRTQADEKWRSLLPTCPWMTCHWHLHVDELADMRVTCLQPGWDDPVSSSVITVPHRFSPLTRPSLGRTFLRANSDVHPHEGGHLPSSCCYLTTVPPAQCVRLLSPEERVLALPQCLQKPRE